MSDTHTLRQTTRDLYTAAEEIRDEEIADVKAQKSEYGERLLAEYDTWRDVPGDERQRYETGFDQQIRELAGTADTYEHYAAEWTDDDGDTCEFVLEELNGDEWAATVDAVSQQAQSGDIPEGYGRVKALEFGVEEIPDGWPADPGVWPAPIINELFEALEGITAPSGVNLGNDSVRSLFETATETPTPAAPSSLQ